MSESERYGCRPQRHVHEILGSVEVAEVSTDPHNHRFALVSDQAVSIGNDDHAHDLTFRTDFYEDHFHEFCGRTGGMIPVGPAGDRHVHFLQSVTEPREGHMHDFRFATMINDPIGD